MRTFLLKLFFRLIKNYSIFFVTEDTAWYVNDIVIDTEMKEIILSCVWRESCEVNDTE